MEVSAEEVFDKNLWTMSESKQGVYLEEEESQQSEQKCLDQVGGWRWSRETFRKLEVVGADEQGWGGNRLPSHIRQAVSEPSSNCEGRPVGSKKWSRMTWILFEKTCPSEKRALQWGQWQSWDGSLLGYIYIVL